LEHEFLLTSLLCCAFPSNFAVSSPRDRLLHRQKTLRLEPTVVKLFKDGKGKAGG